MNRFRYKAQDTPGARLHGSTEWQYRGFWRTCLLYFTKLSMNQVNCPVYAY
jgi:hypothetical protein